MYETKSRHACIGLFAALSLANIYSQAQTVTSVGIDKSLTNPAISQPVAAPQALPMFAVMGKLTSQDQTNKTH